VGVVWWVSVSVGRKRKRKEGELWGCLWVGRGRKEGSGVVCGWEEEGRRDQSKKAIIVS